MNVSTRYGRERIRRGAIHFLLGKGFSSVAGFAVLLLLVRYLPVADFAAYSILQAFVEIFTALTGLGLIHAVLRYAPELYAKHENRVLRGFVLWIFSLRLMLLTLAALVAYVAGAQIAGVFGLGEWVPVFQAYLAVVWVRVNAHFLLQILESTLHQGRGQTAFVVTTLLKLTFISWLVVGGNVDLLAVVWAEFAAELAGLLMLAIGLAGALREEDTAQGSSELAAWWADNAHRVTSYGLAGYLQHLAILPYGSAPNRLVAGRFLEMASVASFGFAQSFMDMLRRYLPAQLLVGLIRPVLVARFATRGDFGEVAGTIAFVFRINTILLGLAAAPLLAVGAPVVAFVTGGKYGSEAALLFAALVGVLVLESRRFLLDMAIQAVEQYRVLVTANFGLSASLLLAIVLIPILGPMAIPLASGLGLLGSNAWIAHRLSQAGFSSPFGILDFARVVGSVVAAAALGYAIASLAIWQAGFVVTCLVYPLLLLVTRALRREDLALMRHLRSQPVDVKANEMIAAR